LINNDGGGGVKMAKSLDALYGALRVFQLPASLHNSDTGLPDKPSSTILVLVLESHLLLFMAALPIAFSNLTILTS